MSIRIGINPLTWTNDDLPSLGAETPLETCLAEAREAGYAGIELGNKFPRDPAVLGPIMDRAGLDIVSGWYSGALLARDAAAEIEALQPHLRLLKAMGSRVMVFAEVTDCVHGRQDIPVSRRPVLGDDHWQLFADRLTEVGDYLRDQGVGLAFHHHMGTVVETEAEIDRLMALTGPSVGLLLDTGHMTYAQGDPHAVLARHGARVNHVHCKDVRRQVLERARADDMSFLQSVLAGVFTVPGDGMVDFARLARQLKQLGYDGWLVVEAEQDPAKAHPLTYAKMGYQTLRDVTDAAGLTRV